MNYKEIIKMIENSSCENYKEFVKAFLSFEKDIEDESILERVYEKYMEDDQMSLLNDKFDMLAKKYIIMALHKKAVKEGHYKIAKLLFELLTKRHVKLYLSDAEFRVQTMLEEAGISMVYDGRRGLYAEAFL